MKRPRGLLTTERTLACPLNWRYTVVLKPKPGEWPPPKTPANRPTGPKTTEAVKNSGPQAKERGLCTKCYREPAKPNKAYCEQCCKKIREHRAGKKQKPNGPRVLESKPIPLSLSIEGTEPVTFPLFDQPDRQEHGDGASSTEQKPNRPKVPESKPNALPQNEEGPEEAHLPLFDFFGLEKCAFEPKFDLNQESAI